MPIPIICPGCKAQFRVSEKFAGKEGPCPKCKTLIKIPAVEEVKIHAPDEPAAAPGKAQPGASTRPTTRKKFEVSPVAWTVIGGGSLLVLLTAWFAGEFFVQNHVLAGAGLLLVSIPLAAGCYQILRNDELEPYRGTEQWIRAAICGVVYAGLWAGFAFLPATLFTNNWNWLFLPVPFLLVGWATAYFTFDLSAENGFFHYAFYLLITMVLRALIGLPALWNLAPAATPGAI